MRFEHACIEAVATAVPDERVSSAAIEERLAPLYERLKLQSGRLQLMTGIAERRLWPAGMLPSEAAARAGEEALRRSSAPREEIDLLIHASVCRDRMEPASACAVHRRLGLGPGTLLFDLSNACLGFLDAMVLAGQMIDRGAIRRALVVAGEDARGLLEGTLRRLLEPDITRADLKAHFASLTIGSGAAAAVLAHRAQVRRPLSLIAATAGAATDHAALCEGGPVGEGRLEMATDSEELLQQGIGLASTTWRRFLDTTGWGSQSPARIITHQVGRAHCRELVAALGLEEKKVHLTYEYFGNMGSVSLPFTLAAALEFEALAAGDRVALLGIGSGINCLMLAVRQD